MTAARQGRRSVYPGALRASSREEYAKLRRASNRDVYDDSKDTTLPIAREIVETYLRTGTKLPWYIDLLNVNLNNHDLTERAAGSSAWSRCSSPMAPA